MALIREEFPGQSVVDFESALSADTKNRYQAAFRYLIGRRGQQAANEVIRRSVWKARKLLPSIQYVPSSTTSDEICRSCDTDLEGWLLPPAVAATGALIAKYPLRFGRTALTTNFDPLLEVSIAHGGGVHFRTVLHSDGNIGQTEGTGCHVIHLHGYWHGADTLHTPRQLAQARPLLKSSLATLIRGKTVVICGYSGWDDAFTSALAEVAADDSAYPEIVWAFRSTTPTISEGLTTKLSPAADRGRVNFYGGVDCHDFFPKLLTSWLALEDAQPPIITPIYSPKVLALVSVQHETAPREQASLLEGQEEDRPPLVDLCVGREIELRQVQSTQQRACFITGLGGQGKSTVAARYFSECQKSKQFDLYVWRDCKEESERLENQVVSIIERLTKGAVRARDISTQPVEVLAELVVKHAGEKRILFVFDNVDHYIDLENNQLGPAPQRFLDSFLNLESRCRIVFTCRPNVSYSTQSILNLRLGGLTLDAAQRLFSERKVVVSSDHLRDAHLFTKGHAFWLDLLAAQIAKKPNLHLPDLLTRSSQDLGDIPVATLQSIWNSLNDQEQIVLKALAESVKPETEARLGEYLGRGMRFNKMMKALRSLRALNLIVVKPHPESSDVVELHPLLRQFIRRSFPQQERLLILDLIIEVYRSFLGIHKRELQRRPKYAILLNWTEAAELDVEANKFDDAFSCLGDVADAFEGSGYPGEYVRVARLLFDKFDWSMHATHKSFDVVFKSFVRILTESSRFEETEALLDKYSETLAVRDSRYIQYCDLKTYAFWARGKFAEAIKWGKDGVRLKNESSVDTKYDSAHSLALAQRDGGDIDPALESFLMGRPLTDVIDPDELDEGRGGDYYGNIGRCLHFMGQIDPAITCYRKSAILIEKSAAQEHVVNQGFIRRWIGELLLMRGEHCSAKQFLEAACYKWEQVSPHRSSEVQQILESNRGKFAECEMLAAHERERYCVAWIYGRDRE